MSQKEGKSEYKFKSEDLLRKQVYFKCKEGPYAGLNFSFTYCLGSPFLFVKISLNREYIPHIKEELKGDGLTKNLKIRCKNILTDFRNFIDVTPNISALEQLEGEQFYCMSFNDPKEMAKIITFLEGRGVFELESVKGYGPSSQDDDKGGKIALMGMRDKLPTSYPVAVQQREVFLHFQATMFQMLAFMCKTSVGIKGSELIGKINEYLEQDKNRNNYMGLLNLLQGQLPKSKKSLFGRPKKDEYTEEHSIALTAIIQKFEKYHTQYQELTTRNILRKEKGYEEVIERAEVLVGPLEYFYGKCTNIIKDLEQNKTVDDLEDTLVAFQNMYNNVPHVKEEYSKGLNVKIQAFHAKLQGLFQILLNNKKLGLRYINDYILLRTGKTLKEYLAPADGLREIREIGNMYRMLGALVANIKDQRGENAGEILLGLDMTAAQALRQLQSCRERLEVMAPAIKEKEGADKKNGPLFQKSKNKQGGMIPQSGTLFEVKKDKPQIPAGGADKSEQKLPKIAQAELPGFIKESKEEKDKQPKVDSADPSAQKPPAKNEDKDEPKSWECPIAWKYFRKRQVMKDPWILHGITYEKANILAYLRALKASQSKVEINGRPVELNEKGEPASAFFPNTPAKDLLLRMPDLQPKLQVPPVNSLFASPELKVSLPLPYECELIENQLNQPPVRDVAAPLRRVMIIPPEQEIIDTCNIWECPIAWRYFGLRQPMKNPCRVNGTDYEEGNMLAYLEMHGNVDPKGQPVVAIYKDLEFQKWVLGEKYTRQLARPIKEEEELQEQANVPKSP